MAANVHHKCIKKSMVVFMAVFAMAIATSGIFCERTDASSKDTIVIARAMDFNSLDPNRAWCDSCKIYVGAAYETLVGLAADNKTIVPKVAESLRRMRVSSHPVSTRRHLRNGAAQ